MDNITIFDRKGFLKYLNNTGWLISNKAIRIIFNFFVVIFVARYLGPEKYGLLSYAISYIALFAAFSRCGIDEVLVREIVEYPDKGQVFLRSALCIRISGAIAAVITALVLHFMFFERFGAQTIIIILSGTLLIQSFDIFEKWFIARVKSKTPSTSRIISTVLGAAAKITLVIFKADLVWFAVVILLEELLFIFLLSGAFMVRQGIKMTWIPKWEISKGMLKNSWPLLLSGIAVSVYMRIDQVMMRVFTNSSAVGNFAVSVKLCELWYFLPVAITNSLFPAIINAKKSSLLLYETRMKAFYSVMTWLALLIIFVYVVLGDVMISAFFGESYAHAGIILKTYVLSTLFVFLGVSSGRYVIAENLTRITFYRTFLGMITNVFLNLIFIPLWGGIGAAAATVISYGIATYFILVPKTTRYNGIMMLKAIDPRCFLRVLK